MGRPMFSVIMPVYNAENYIKTSINSVVNQTFGDWQLILIDDCSTDKSLQMCESYKNDNRVEVIHLEANAGAANARNIGIGKAIGKYVTFMDADDYLDADAFAKVFSILDATPAHLTVLGAIEEYYNADGEMIDQANIMPILEEDQVSIYNDGSNIGETLKVLFLNDIQAVRSHIIHLEKSTLYGYLWNKFYDTDYLKEIDIKLEDCALLEDARFNALYAMDISSMNLINIAPYHYCKRESDKGRLTSKYIDNYYEIHYDHINRLFSQQITWGNADKYTRGVLGSIYARYILSALQRNCDERSGMSHADRKKWFVDVVNDNLYNELIDFAQGNGVLNGILIGILKGKQIWLNLTVGKVIYIIKVKYPNLFAKARKKR